jgi:DNA topoisomerase IA
MSVTVVAVDASVTRLATLSSLFATIVPVESCRAGWRRRLRARVAGASDVWVYADCELAAAAVERVIRPISGLDPTAIHRFRPDALTPSEVWRALQASANTVVVDPGRVASARARAGLERALGAVAGRLLWAHLDGAGNQGRRLRLRLRLTLATCATLRALCAMARPAPPRPRPRPRPRERERRPLTAPGDDDEARVDRVRTPPPDAFDLPTLQAAACRVRPGDCSTAAAAAAAVASLFDAGHIAVRRFGSSKAAVAAAVAAAREAWPQSFLGGATAPGGAPFRESGPRRPCLVPTDPAEAAAVRVPAPLRPVYDLIRRRALAAVMPSALHEYRVGPRAVQRRVLRPGFLAAVPESREGADLDYNVDGDGDGGGDGDGDGGGDGVEEAALVERLDGDGPSDPAAIEGLVRDGYASRDARTGRLHPTGLGRALLHVLDTDLVGVADGAALARVHRALGDIANIDAHALALAHAHAVVTIAHRTLRNAGSRRVGVTGGTRRAAVGW